LTWSQTTPDRAEHGLRLSTALVFFWTVRGYFQEGQRWLERGLAQAGEIDEALRAKALAGAGTMAWCLGNYEAAIQFHQSSLDSYRRLGDQHGIAQALQNLGVQAFHQLRYEEAVVLLKASLKLRRELGDKAGIANALISLGVAARKQNDLAQAIRYYEEALGLYRELGDTRWIAGTLLNMGIAVFDQGDYCRAGQLHRESLPMFVALGDRQALPESLGGLAEVHWVLGQPQRAAQLFGAIETLREATGVPLADVYLPAHLRLLDEIRAQLGADAFAAARASGQTMTLEQAVALALDEEGLVGKQ
jgi:non-specific serine/threonine protein kinase